ncbi:WYL domain-containing protein [Nonomuraea sp. SYSU D8015]|uniref:WYL domain-containing protein n=1 Tax=Nonomuraea sp. SYSU D8015 TaxID=2593644 RepID=UPI003FA52F8C
MRLSALADVEALPGRSTRRAERDVLIPAALACRTNEAVRIRHRRHDVVHASPADVQPHRLVTQQRRWYLVACPGGDGVDGLRPRPH